MPLDDELTKFLSGIVRPKPSGDRITDALKTRSGQPIGFGEVIARSINTGQGFGESLNAIKAKALAVDAAEQEMDLSQRRVDLSEEQLQFDKLKFAADQGDARAGAIWEQYDRAVKNMSPAAALSAQKALLNDEILGGSGPKDETEARIRATTILGPYLTPAKAKPTTPAQKDALALGYKPGTPEYKAFVREKSLKPGVEINLASPQKPPPGYRYKDDTFSELEPIPGGPAQKDFRKAMNVFGRIESSLGKYREILKKHGAEILPGSAKLELESAYTDILLEMKELNELGAITGPDYDLMLSLLVDPTSFRAKALETLEGQQALETQLGLIQSKIDAGKARTQELYGTATKTETKPQPPSDEPDAVFSGYDLETGHKVFKRPDETYFLVPE